MSPFFQGSETNVPTYFLSVLNTEAYFHFIRQRLVFTGLLAHTVHTYILACNTFCDRHAHHVSGSKQSWLAKRQVMEFTGIFSK